MGGTNGARRSRGKSRRDVKRNSSTAEDSGAGDVRISGQLVMAAVAEQCSSAERHGKREARLGIEWEVRNGRREGEEEGSNAG